MASVSRRSRRCCSASSFANISSEEQAAGNMCCDLAADRLHAINGEQKGNNYSHLLFKEVHYNNAEHSVTMLQMFFKVAPRL